MARIEIVSNATRAKLLKPDREAKILLTELLSYYVQGYENTYAYKNGTWDGKSTMFSWQTDTFPVGFLTTVGRELEARGYEVTVLAKALPAPLGTVPEKLGGFSYTDRYDYQWQTTEQLCNRGTMIARLATGAGKTFAAALAIAKINRPTLILTKRQPLMYQFAERMVDFGFDPGVIGDGVADIKSELTVAMSQTLSNRLDEREIKDYLETIEFVIGEEVHEISDNSYWNIIQSCPNAHYKLGLTATPFMREKSESNMKLLGAFGRVGIDVTEKMLIDRGINARPIFKFADYECPKGIKFGSNYQKAVTNGITTNVSRNNAIVEHAVKAVEKGLPVLVLVQRQEHGKILLDMFKEAGISSEFIFGESKSAKRKEGLDNLSKGITKVLIGSTIVDVGVDVPSIGLVIMAGGGKAQVAYRQRIGRGLREKKTGANICFILDFNDEHNRHLHDHCLERKSIILNTPGFKENLLPKGQDFPWHLM
jgi:superfamily II DNA or RNA helicase